jgi:hypothetical protein
MRKRRLVGVLFFGSVLLAAGVAPAGAGPALSGVLRGPNAGICYGGSGTDAFGTASIQAGKAKVAPPADQRWLRVDVAADKVPARTTFEVRLSATVVVTTPGGSGVGCGLWSAGLTVSSAGGMVRFTATVAVPNDIAGFQVHLGSTGTPGVGYATTIATPVP